MFLIISNLKCVIALMFLMSKILNVRFCLFFTFKKRVTDFTLTALLFKGCPALPAYVVSWIEETNEENISAEELIL